MTSYSAFRDLLESRYEAISSGPTRKIRDVWIIMRERGCQEGSWEESKAFIQQTMSRGTKVRRNIAIRGAEVYLIFEVAQFNWLILYVVENDVG